MEFIFEIAGELLLQILGEALVELSLHRLKETFKKPPRNPALSFVGYLLWGAIVGGLSLFVFRSSFISSPTVRIANLIITPLLIGGVMVIFGKLREKRGQTLVRLDRFSYAVAFAFAMALVRFMFAH